MTFNDLMLMACLGAVAIAALAVFVWFTVAIRLNGDWPFLGIGRPFDE